MVVKSKLWDFIGRYDKIDHESIYDLINNFHSNNKYLEKQVFIEKLKTMSVQQWVFLNDIVNLANSLNVTIDTNILKTYLSKRSIFMNKVPGRVIKEFLIPFLSINNPKYFEDLKAKINNEDGDHNIKIKISQAPSIKRNKTLKTVSFGATDQLEIPENFDEINIKSIKAVLFKIADFLFDGKISFVELLNKSPKIIDRVIDGKEYQIIKRQDMFDIFVNSGIKISLFEQEELKFVARHLFLDYVDVGKVQLVIYYFRYDEANLWRPWDQRRHSSTIFRKGL